MHFYQKTSIILARTSSHEPSATNILQQGLFQDTLSAHVANAKYNYVKLESVSKI